MTAPRWDDPGPVAPRSFQSPVIRVDPEWVEGLVGRLEGVIRELVIAELRLNEAGVVRPPGADPVSRNAAFQGAQMLEGATSYLRTWRDQLIVTHDALRKQRGAYLSADKPT